MVRGLLAVAAAAALAVGVAQLGAGAASAAADPIGLSSDGSTFSPSYSGSLFGGVVIVPGGTATRSFWVKNQESGYGYLALALDNVSSADAGFPPALTIRANSGAAHGQPIAFTAADPCVPLLEGILLNAGDVVRIDVTISLSDALTGLDSQGSIAEFDLRVAMTSADATASDGCNAAIPPAPAPPSGESTTPGGGRGGGASAVLIPGTGIGTGTPTFSPTPKPTDPEAAPEPDGGDADDASGDVFWNTGRLYQEYYVAWWVLAVLLGGAWAWFRDRRRERISE